MEQQEYTPMSQQTKKSFNYKSAMAFLCVLCMLILISNIGLVIYILMDRNNVPDGNKTYDTFVTLQDAFEEDDFDIEHIVKLAQDYQEQGIISGYEEQENGILIESSDGVNYLYTDAETEEETENLSVSVVTPTEDNASGEIQFDDLTFFDDTNDGKFFHWDGHIVFTHRFGPVFRTNIRVNNKDIWKKYVTQLRNRDIIAGRHYFYLCPSYFRNHIRANGMRNSIFILHNDACVRDDRLLQVLFEKGIGLVVIIDNTLEKDMQQELASMFIKKLSERTEDGNFRNAKDCYATVWEQFCKDHPDFTDRANALQMHFPDGKDDFRLPKATAPGTSEPAEQPTTALAEPTTQDSQFQPVISPLTVDTAENIVKNASKMIIKWITGAQYSYTQTVKSGDWDYGLVSQSKAEMKSELCAYLHESYFEEIFETYYIERNNKLYYRIGGFGLEGANTVVRSDLEQKNDSYVLTMHSVYYSALGGTQLDEKCEDLKLTFINAGDNWVIDDIGKGGYWLFPCILFVSDKKVTMPTAFSNPIEARMDSFGNEDGMSVNMRTGPGTNNSIIKKIPDNSKIYVCGTSEEYPDWFFVCYLGDFGWTINNCIFY